MTTRILVLTLGLLTSISVLAQTPSRDSEKGFIPGVPYASSDAENINLTNGNLAYSFPLGSLPSGRGTATAGLFLRYNSKLWKKEIQYVTEDSETTRQTFLGYDGDGGWNYGTTYQLLVTSRNDGLDEPLQVCNQPSGPANLDAIYTTKVQIQFPDGSKREFWPTGASIAGHGRYFNIHPSGQIKTLSGGCGVTVSQHPGPYITYYSIDGSYMNLKVYPNLEWELSMADGSRVTNNSSEGHRVYDRNGNYVSYGGVTLPDSSTAVGWVDQFGRYVATKHTAPNEDTIYQFGFGGQLLETKVRWKTITVIKKYHTECSDCTFTRGQTSDQVAYMTFQVVDEIESPNGLISSFGYHAHDGDVALNPTGGTTNQNWSPGWGEVKSLTMPSTAKTEYNYKIYEQSLNQITPTFVIDRSGRTTEKTLFYDEEYDGATTPKQDKWLYTSSKTGGGFVGPDGRGSGQAVFHIDNDEDLGGQVYQTTNSDGTLTEKQWAFNNPSGFAPEKLANPYVKAEYYTIPNATGEPSLTAIKNLTYDKNGNVTQMEEYDWVPYSSITHDASGRVTGVSGSPPLKRVTKTAYNNATPTASDSTTLSDNAYWKSTAPRLRSLPSGTEVQDAAGTPKARSEFAYDNTAYGTNTIAGNVIETKTWDSFKNGTAQAYSNPLTSTNSISTSATYNQYGMPVTMTDARLIVTEITYGNVTGTVSGLYPTQTVAAYGTNVARTSAAVYDFYTGLVKTATDVDNNVSVVTEYDMLGRPTKIRNAADSLLESWTRTEYDDTNRRVVVRGDIEAVGDGRKVSIQHYDELGRVCLTRTLENAATEDPYNETHGIKVETRYGYNDPTPNDPSDPASTIGTYSLVSNPFRAARATQATGEPTMGWMRYYAAKTGRRSETEAFGGASLPAPWGSNSSTTGVVVSEADSAILQTGIGASITTVTDQAGKMRRSLTNALGHLIRVDEPDENNNLGAVTSPYQPTGYSYDVLNNLLTVTQASATTAQCGGSSSCSQTRTFAYSSLSRLKSATNPESGAISYGYDPNGNLTMKTDARGVQTDYAYDQLNRITSRSYSLTGATPASYQASPNVTYLYGTTTPAVGKLTKVSTGTGANLSTTEYVSFDILGRVTRSKQTTDGILYGDDANPMTYSYNLSGALIEQQYPSGRKVRNELDVSGDLATVESQKNPSNTYWTYANRFTYNAAGAATSMRLGNGRWESTQFNSRLQPTQIALGKTQNATDLLKLDYSYGTTANNGNVMSQTITVPTVGATPGFAALQNYTYDSLNRIKTATETLTPTTGSPETWTQEFRYDRYGNRTFNEDTTTTLPKQCSGNTEVCADIRPVVNPAADPSNNKLNGYSFDATGNTKQDAENRKFTYDSENKQVKVETVSGTTVTGTIGEYFYDGNGKRIKKRAYTNNAVTEETIFVYDASGKLVGEYSNEVASQPKVAYLSNDHLSSPRINTDINGNVTARHDYRPFGEEIATPRRGPGIEYADDSARKQFTGYERDGETDLDFAQARYYSNRLGRFASPDDFKSDSDVRDPQSWDKYSYVRNNPLNLVDPSGKKADIDVQVDRKAKIVTLTVTASVGIWAKGGKRFQPDLAKVKKNIEAQIKKWAGSQKIAGGYTLNVNMNVTVKTFGSAKSSDDVLKADNTITNVIQLVDRPAKAECAGGNSCIGTNSDPATINNPDGSLPDVGTWRYTTARDKNEPAHEFFHILGKSHNAQEMYGDGWTGNPFAEQGTNNSSGATLYDYTRAFGDDVTAGINAARQEDSKWWFQSKRDVIMRPTRTARCCSQ